MLMYCKLFFVFFILSFAFLFRLHFFNTLTHCMLTSINDTPYDATTDAQLKVTVKNLICSASRFVCMFIWLVQCVRFFYMNENLCGVWLNSVSPHTMNSIHTLLSNDWSVCMCMFIYMLF